MMDKRRTLCARIFDDYQPIFQLTETISDYFIVTVTQKLAEIYPYEIKMQITLLRLVTTLFLGMSPNEKEHVASPEKRSLRLILVGRRKKLK